MKSRMAFFGIVFLLSSQFCLAQWVKQGPPPRNFASSKIQFVSDNTGWITGGGKKIYKTVDGGQEWLPVTISASNSYIGTIIFIDENTGFAASTSGSLLKSNDAGTTWSVVQLNTADTLIDINFFGSQHVWVLTSTSLFRSVDAGSNWQQITSPGVFFKTIWFYNSRIGFAIGGNKVRMTEDGGSSWSDVNTGTTNSVSKIILTDQNNGWLIGAQKTLKRTVNGGVSWVDVNLPGGSDTDLKDIVCLNNSKIMITNSTKSFYTSTDGGSSWVAGIYYPYFDDINNLSLRGEEIWGIGSGVLQTTDFCVSWKDINRKYQENFWGVHFTDEDNGWVAGSNGTILKTTNGGDWWAKSKINTNVNLYQIQFFDANLGIVCGNGGSIYFTSDGGANWVAQNSNTTMDLFGMYFSDRFYGIVVGKHGTILRTTDGGANWSIVPSNTTKNLNGIHSTDPNNWWITGSQRTMLFSSDNGLQWNSKFVSSDSADYIDVHFYDSMRGWAVGLRYHNFNPNIAPNAIAVRTTDAGATWTTRKEDIQIYYSIFATSAYDVYIGTLQGEVYHSTDGGLDYIRENLLVGTRPMYDMYFVNPTTGWVVGRDGHIFKTTSGTVSTSIDDQPGGTPEDYSLLQNYPNPFNPSTVLTFTLPQSSHVRLDIYDITGRKIQTLVNKTLQPGTHTAEFNASAFSSGIYIAKITADSYSQTVKMTYLK